MDEQVLFITGATGFLGRHIVQAALAHAPEAEIRLLIRGRGVPRLPDALTGRIRLIRGDILHPESYQSALRGVDTVIHSAALLSFNKTDREAIFRTNVDGTRALLHAAAANSCRNFIHISSISAVGRQPGCLSDESLFPELEALARDPYAFSKVRAEREVLRFSGQMRVVRANVIWTHPGGL